jgi:hypothetical protein
MEQPLSESRFAQFQFGFFLVVPYSMHLVLTALVLILGVVLLGPGILLAKYALCLSLAATAFQMLLGGAMSIQAISRPSSRVVMASGRIPTTEAYFMAPVGSDIAIIGFAVVAALGALLFAINLTAALCGCPRPLTSCNATTLDDFGELERRPNFFTDLAWQSICGETYAITIAWTVLAYAMAVLDVVVIFHEGRLRALTEQLYGIIKKGSGPAETYVELPSVEQGMEGVDVLVARLTRRNFLSPN